MDTNNWFQMGNISSIRWIYVTVLTFIVLDVVAVSFFCGFMYSRAYFMASDNSYNTIKVGSKAQSTALWETYKNDKYSFSLKEPGTGDKDCSISTPNNGKAQSLVCYAESGGKKGTDVPFNGFQISIESLSPSTTLSDYVKNAMDYTSNVVKNGMVPGISAHFVQSSVKLDGVDAIEVITDNASYGTRTVYVLSQDSKSVISIGDIEEKKGSFNNTFSTILSTFTFTK